MGGRAAEELFMNHITTGAGNDIERATEMARKMVCEWGMSSKLGPLSFGKTEQQIFLGKEIARHHDYSESTAIEIDDEIKKFVTTAYDRARSLLDRHRDAMVRLAEALLEREVLDLDEIKILVEGGQLPPLEATDGQDEPPGIPVDGEQAGDRREDEGPGPVLGDPLGQPS